jgi:hypothetical protein
VIYLDILNFFLPRARLHSHPPLPPCPLAVFTAPCSARRRLAQSIPYEEATTGYIEIRGIRVWWKISSITFFIRLAALRPILHESWIRPTRAEESPPTIKRPFFPTDPYVSYVLADLASVAANLADEKRHRGLRRFPQLMNIRNSEYTSCRYY